MTAHSLPVFPRAGPLHLSRENGEAASAATALERPTVPNSTGRTIFAASGKMHVRQIPERMGILYGGEAVGHFHMPP
jgi:hypothetical protein